MSLVDGIENYNVMNALLKAQAVIPRYLHVAVSISGGSDSDIMLDIVEKVKGNTKVTYYFIDTGLEYQATKDHLDYLEDRYGIKIERVKAKKSIPTVIQKFGVPFVSKYVADFIARLQRHNFNFTDMGVEEMRERYPKIKSASNWWNNVGTFNQFNISYNKGLKEFLIENPPDYKISSYCCEGSKKLTAHKYLEDTGAQLSCVGVRKAEGGVRASAYSSCWDENHKSGIDKFRPVFWLTDEDKRYYNEKFGIVNSRCYSEWGFRRTGCVGCPFNKNIEDELKAIEMFEPKMYKACMAIFGKSYEYTKKYRAFQAEMKAREKSGDQLLLTELAERIE